MEIIKSVSSIREYSNKHRYAGKTIAFVPTMGALHDGHLSLVKIAKETADIVIVSIFINPKQFAAHEDLDTYPNNIESDIEKLAPFDIDVLYTPKASEIYSTNFLTQIHVDKVADGLCTNIRPHFFDGVAIIVTKLLNQILPDFAIFGEKDYQQITMVRQIVKDLDIPTKIIGGDIVREKDGLAMSSRNIYLEPEERIIASGLYSVISDMRNKLKEGNNLISTIEWGKEQLLGKGFLEVEYLEARNANSLDTLEEYQENNTRILAAVRMNSCRLIDNVAA